ncbi:MAG: YfhL family 4Fe-4S dicluster ferredoxin [Chloroflexi bacterium]|nr:YfhL family 4Fe-4S dicluster ferredoxin [Chloroflexota bacterium]
MSYMITDECISCGACESECPNEAISEGDIQFVIDPQKCTECIGAFDSSQCADVCPVDACIPDPNHPETKEQLLKKWNELHPGKAPTAGTH